MTTDEGRERRTASAGPVREARRLRRVGPGDARLWLGLVLVLASMILGARILSAGEETVTVYRASRDLSTGAPLADLERVRVPWAAAGAAYLDAEPPPGAVLRWPVAAGELVPAAAVAATAQADTRRVTIPVDPQHLPPDLAAGDLVDVWSSPRESEVGDPHLVLAGVAVAGASADVSLGGDVSISLDVPTDRVLSVVSAARRGVVDLVAVPLSSQPVSVGEPS